MNNQINSASNNQIFTPTSFNNFFEISEGYFLPRSRINQLIEVKYVLHYGNGASIRYQICAYFPKILNNIDSSNSDTVQTITVTKPIEDMSSMLLQLKVFITELDYFISQGSKND